MRRWRVVFLFAAASRGWFAMLVARTVAARLLRNGARCVRRQHEVFSSLSCPSSSSTSPASTPTTVLAARVLPRNGTSTTETGSVFLDLSNGTHMEYDALWLAHNCVSLRQPKTGQRIYSLESLLPQEDMTSVDLIRDAQLSKDCLLYTSPSPRDRG